MLRNRLLPVARLVSPIVAAALLLPASVMAQEALPTPVPGQTPTTVTNVASAGTTQEQAPGTQTQLSPGGPQTQSQQLTPLPGGPLPLSPGSVNMQPQIQVLVQPQIQVSAQPKGDAAPNAKADVNQNVSANTTPTVTSTTETVTKTSTPIVAQPYTPYQPQRYAPPPPRVVTRIVTQPQQYKPYKQLKPLPRRKGLMITGWIMFSVSYLLTASNAADLYDRCPGMSDPGRCRELARDMFIPVAGPFMAMEHTKYATDDYSLAVAGSLQGAGLLMGVIGTAMFVRDGQRNRIINEYGLRVSKNVRLAPKANAMGGGGLTLRAAF